MRDIAFDYKLGQVPLFMTGISLRNSTDTFNDDIE